MKKIILTLGFSFILAVGYSQNSDYKKNEISIGIINLTESPKNQENLFENSYYLVPFSNLTYKRYLNERNALRLTFFRPINKSYDKSGGSIMSKGKYKEQIIKIGYEYIFKQKKITPYIAIDIAYLKSSSSSIFGGGIAASFSELESAINSFGLSPTIGVNYNIYKSIYLGLESNLSILLFNEDKTSTTSSLLEETIIKTETDNYFEYIFNPILFSMKIKF